MARRWIVMTLLLASMGHVVLADDEAFNRPYRQYSPNKQFYIEMIPQDGSGGYGPGEGIVRRAASGEIVSKVNWYALEVVLSNDGRHLIRLGPGSARDQEGLADLAIGFYTGGKELKTYLVRDLIRDRGKVRMSESHYQWRSSRGGFSPDQKRYTLVLIDGGVYEFDVATGKIVSHKKQPRSFPGSGAS